MEKTSFTKFYFRLQTYFVKTLIFTNGLQIKIELGMTPTKGVKVIQVMSKKRYYDKIENVDLVWSVTEDDKECGNPDAPKGTKKKL